MAPITSRIAEGSRCYPKMVVNDDCKQPNRFLLVETKRPGESVELGERRLWQSLARQGKHWTVWLVHGNPEDGVPLDLAVVVADGVGAAEPTSRDDFQRRIDAWFAA